MKKVIIIPDSFKGTLSAKQICRILKEKVHQQFPACEVVTVPVADGGEGSVDCFLEALGGRKETVQVHGPYMELMEAEYGILSDGTAVVEMASCAGLPLVEDRKNPKKTTTYGVGELILAAAKAGSKRIITGLGGSCTNDGGCGMAAALGIRFYDAQDREFVPTGGTLKEIRRIDMSRREKLLDQIELLAMCDITNPLTGPEGAAHVFSPQKGADEGMIQELEAGMVHYASILEQTVQIPKIRELPGGGAAGGMGTGMAALILTGEGKIDSQSIHGKVLSGIARRGKALGIPVVAIAGGIDREALPELYRDGLTAAFSINQLPEDFSVSRGKSMENLETEMENLLRLIAAFPANS